ncbi:MAG: hypothetical protein BWX64_01605 [Acidobacteria bacterium ADurb.Bin051]|nr:MAG: hypothetical protein BWX64_01605 [Acidobacteria bacterium ADurb.Bin051]
MDDLVGLPFEQLEIVAVDLHRDIRAHAREELGDAQLDRLREAEDRAGDLRLERRLDRRDERLLVAVAPPFRRREHEIGVGDLHPHRVGGDLGPAGARDDGLDLVGEPLAQQPFGGERDLVRLRQRDRRETPDLHGDRPLVELRDELRAEEGDERERGDEDRDRDHGRQPPPAERPVEQRHVEPLGEPEEPRLALRRLPHQQAREHRHQGERRHQRGREREDHRERHRPEHLPLHPAQREDRQVDEDDDADRDDHRAGDLVGRRADLLQVRDAGLPPPLVERADDVLDHHHRAVDDEAEVDRPEAHQVARDPELAHRDERHEHRERDRRGDDEPAAQVAEEQEEHDDHQQAALGEVLRDGVDRPPDEVGAVVEGVDRHPFGEVLGDLGELALHPVDDDPRVLAHQHHDDADHRLAPPVAGHRPLAEHRRKLHGGDVADGHRGTRRVVGEDDRADGGQVGEQPLAADQVLLSLVHEVAAAHRAVARPQRGEDLAHREAVGGEPLGVEGHLEGLQLAAERVHLDDPRHRAELVVDVPVEDRAQLHRGVAPLGRRAPCRAGAVGAHLELVDLAEAGRDRPELRLAVPLRDPLAGDGEPLAHELAGPVDVGPLVEDDGDDREPEAGERADLLDPRQAAHRRLHREGDEPLHLLRREPGAVGEDLHLDVRDVRHRVDRQVEQGVDAEAGEEEPERHHQQAVVEREVDEAADHRGLSGGSQWLCPPPSSSRASSDLTKKAPSITTSSPAARPERTSTYPSPRRPRVTGRRENRPSSRAT